MTNYSLNILQLIGRLIPAHLRTASMWAWMYALAYPLEYLYDLLIAFVSKTNLEASITGQVIYLEHILNHVFDAVNERIYISDGDGLGETYHYFESEEVEGVYLYNEAESDPSPTYYYNQAENNASDTDFIVNVPSVLVYDSVLMNYYINRYRLAGKRYEIQTF